MTHESDSGEDGNFVLHKRDESDPDDLQIEAAPGMAEELAMALSTDPNGARVFEELIENMKLHGRVVAKLKRGEPITADERAFMDKHIAKVCGHCGEDDIHWEATHCPKCGAEHSREPG